MKLKQEIISLLSHFDDDGNILPNKIVTFKIASTDSFAPSQCKRVDSLIGCMAEGNEYRIEDAPKRPREVWVTFDRTGPLNVSNTIVPTRHDQELIRFIEDTPREVTDADVEYCWGYYMQMHEESAKQAFKRMLQHYEQERSK